MHPGPPAVGWVTSASDFGIVFLVPEGGSDKTGDGLGAQGRDAPAPVQAERAEVRRGDDPRLINCAHSAVL